MNGRARKQAHRSVSVIERVIILDLSIDSFCPFANIRRFKQYHHHQQQQQQRQQHRQMPFKLIIYLYSTERERKKECHSNWLFGPRGMATEPKGCEEDAQTLLRAEKKIENKVIHN